MAPRTETRKVVTFKELLCMAHGRLKSVTTEIIQLPNIENGNMAIFRAVVTMKHEEGDQIFHGTGDAAPTSLKPDMVQHLVRIAETRAVVRALRLATGTGEPAAEEMTDYSETATSGNRKTGAINDSDVQCPRCHAPVGKPHLKPCI